MKINRKRQGLSSLIANDWFVNIACTMGYKGEIMLSVAEFLAGET
jgi:hypothetical protein